MLSPSLPGEALNVRASGPQPRLQRNRSTRGEAGAAAKVSLDPLRARRHHYFAESEKYKEAGAGGGLFSEIRADE